jgi:ribosome-associated protein
VSLPSEIEAVVRAAQAKKAVDAVVLDLRPVADFTDFFVLLSGTNQRQLVAIADAVREALREKEGWRPAHVEGYPRQEWILLDYDRFVIHVFTPATRAFYDLERLWGDGTRVELEGLES